MRNVYTAELARLRWAVVHCRTGQLIGAFANCADACSLRDNGPRNEQGDRLLEVIDCPPKITKPRLRERRRTERALPLRDLLHHDGVTLSEIERDPGAFNVFQRSI